MKIEEGVSEMTSVPCLVAINVITSYSCYNTNVSVLVEFNLTSKPVRTGGLPFPGGSWFLYSNPWVWWHTAESPYHW